MKRKKKLLKQVKKKIKEEKQTLILKQALKK